MIVQQYIGARLGMVWGLITGLVVVGCLLFGRVALAQDATRAPDLQAVTQVAPGEKAAFVENAVAEMRAIAASMQKTFDGAAKSGAQGADCAGAKLSQAQALLQVSEQAQSGLSEALAAGVTERADHELRKVAVAVDKTRQLSAESAACLSKDGQPSGETNLQVSGEAVAEPSDLDPVKTNPFSFDVDPPQLSPFT